METRPIQQRQGCIPNVMKTSKRSCFTTFKPNLECLEKTSDRPVLNHTHNSSLAELVFASPYSSNVSKESNYHTLYREPFNGQRDVKVFINRERKIKTSGLKTSVKGYLQKKSQTLSSF